MHYWAYELLGSVISSSLGVDLLYGDMYDQSCRKVSFT